MAVFGRPFSVFAMPLDRLVLKRELDDPVSKTAISVSLETGEQIGYLNSRLGEETCKRMGKRRALDQLHGSGCRARQGLHGRDDRNCETEEEKGRFARVVAEANAPTLVVIPVAYPPAPPFLLFSWIREKMTALSTRRGFW